MKLTEILSMLGGIGLFLYGMTLMSTGLKNAAGDKLRQILERVTSNRLGALFVGLLVTLLVQSSSATDMMLIGFVDSGLMPMSQAFGVILGANIGTTVTAQITAFDLTALAPFLLFLGCVIVLFVKKPFIQSISTVVLGFGMLFVGIGMMKSAIVPLSRTPSFIALVKALDNPIAGILFGIGFTALLQSSSSSIVIFQAFAQQGILPYNETVWLLIGAAVGSVTPNLLASITASREGKRTALLNLLFNLFRACLLSALILLFPAILRGIQALSPGDVARQVANTHTLFAIAAALVALPLQPLFLKLTHMFLPLLPEETRLKEQKSLAYLEHMEKYPDSVAIHEAQLEVNRMGAFARENLGIAIDYFFHPDEVEKGKRVAELESVVDYLNHAITDKLITLRSRNLSEKDIFRLTKMTQVTSNYERISDHAENIAEFTDRVKNEHAVISEAGLAELSEMSKMVLKTLDVSMEIYSKNQLERLPEAESYEQQVDDMQALFIEHHINRLMESKCDPLGGVIFTDMCTDLERCSDQAINIATALIQENEKPHRAHT
ncbi:MAG: Na/Pi cotransporter family protein [Clostridia bacterium]|nr:Na/Pi cotransporter family protein [Clostridia bacterium]